MYESIKRLYQSFYDEFGKERVKNTKAELASELGELPTHTKLYAELCLRYRTKHTIPRGNWTKHLLDKIEQCADGDTIAVHTEAMKELAEGARARMCPDKKIIFEIETEDVLHKYFE